jgi:S-adenosylmethionine:tRNA-ribosyltransferase-isomerase (queuine synthetase)
MDHYASRTATDRRESEIRKMKRFVEYMFLTQYGRPPLPAYIAPLAQKHTQREVKGFFVTYLILLE